MAPTTTSYTSIPLPTGEVVTRSIRNLIVATSCCRPWSELFSSFCFPDQFSSILVRSRTNLRYFFVNYTIVVGTLAAFALETFGYVALFVVAAIIALWLLFHVFREDPLIIWGFQVGNRTVVLFLVLVSLWALWFTSCIVYLAVGVGFGFVLCAIHSVFRSSDGLFLEEDDAFTGGLIGSS